MRRVFMDFDEFADAISGLNGRYIPTARSQTQWWIDPSRVGDLRLQTVQVGAAATFAGDGEEQQVLTIGIPLTDPRAIRIDGRALPEGGFVLIRRDRPLTYSAQQATRWAGVTVPIQLSEASHFRDAAEWSAAMLADTSMQASSSALRRVSLLIALLCSGDETIDIGDPTAVAAAEEEVLLAAGRLLRASSCANDQRLGRRPMARRRIIARCLQFFAENAGQPILVSDLCAIAEVSERTLRSVFCEYFGVGPVRFLKVRQLQEVRSALMKSGAARDTVTRIATRFGVWDLSSFARNYRAIYGESPSETLRGMRPRRDLPVVDSSLQSMQTWMSYAALCFAKAGADLQPLDRTAAASEVLA